MKHIYNCSGHELKLPEIVKSNNIYLYDKDGKEYMDLESGVWCTCLGHRNEEINSTIAHQLDTVMHAGFCYSSPVLDEAAEAVLDINKMQGGKAVFLCSGSEAIELGRQIAKHLTGNSLSMCLHDSYLGSYSSVVDRQNGWYLFDWTECRSCKDRKSCRKECHKIREIPDTISEFVLEPGSASGFVRFPEESLIKNIVEAVRDRGGKILVNEVTTGIGRTGKWSGYHHFGIDADIVAMGKGLGNGFPVSATALSEDIVEKLNRNDFRYAQSHQNDPLGAAVALKVINLLKEGDLVIKAAEKGKVFLEQLKSLIDGKTVMEVRGRGLMFGLDLASEEIGNRIYEELLERGFIICNRRGLFRIDPPLIIEPEQFTKFIQTFKEIQHILSAD